MPALDQIAGWPVENAAAAVVDVNGLRSVVGDPTFAFRLASVTKPLTALAALVAVEEDAIGLDDAAVADIVPGATIRHLFSHAAGLAMDRAVRAAAPATRRIYSNVGIDRLADAVAEGTGLDFDEYFRAAVAGPLGLIGTTIGEHPSRSGTSTVTDLARVLAELISPTGLLRPSTLAQATTVQFPGLPGVLPGFGRQDPNDWGLGFEIRAHKTPHWTGLGNSPATYGHFGQAGTMIWVDPSVRVGLVALADRAFDRWAAEAWPQLSDAVLAEYA